VQLTTPKRNGRPPKRAHADEPAMLTLRVDGTTKNLLIDQADAYDLSIAEYVAVLVHRDVANQA